MVSTISETYFSMFKNTVLGYPKIDGILKELDLKFIFCELNKNWMTKFHQEYPEKYLLTLLYFWHEFEAENPIIFSRIYPF